LRRDYEVQIKVETDCHTSSIDPSLLSITGQYLTFFISKEVDLYAAVPCD